MAIRRKVTRPPLDEMLALADKAAFRIYTLWLGGLLIDAIGLKSTSLSAGGLNVSFERPELIKGTIFIVCLLYTTGTLMSFSHDEAHWKSPEKIRNLLWSFLPAGRKTFRGLSTVGISRLKAHTRIRIKVYGVLFHVVLLFPAAMIAIFQWKAVFGAVKLILGTS